MENNSKLENKVYLLKFICSLFVIFCHAYNLEVYGINKNDSLISHFISTIENVENLFTTLAVAIFFFISGFLFFYNINQSSISKKLIRRVQTILIPYIIWSTIYYIYFCLVSNLSFSNNVTSLESFTFNYQSWINFLLINEKLIPIWFMETLTIILLFTPLINKVLINKYLSYFSIIILILFNFTPYKNLFSGLLDSNYLLYFIIGSYFGKNKFISSSKTTCIISLILLILFPLSMPISNSKYFFIIVLFGVLCSWSAADLFNINIKWWMKETTFTFVFHEIPLEIIEKLFLLIFGISPIFALIDYIISPLITFILSVYIAKILKKYFIKLYKILI